jgi:predicted DNA-binding transcriptional regulator AlpA
MKEGSTTMTMPELAVALGISTGLTYQLANQDRLPVKVIRLGNKRKVVSRAAVAEFLSGKRNIINKRQAK